MNQPYVAAIDIGAPAYVQHHGVKEWVARFARLPNRTRIQWCDGSRERVRPALRGDGRVGNAEAATASAHPSAGASGAPTEWTQGTKCPLLREFPHLFRHARHDVHADQPRRASPVSSMPICASATRAAPWRTDHIQGPAAAYSLARARSTSRASPPDRPSCWSDPHLPFSESRLKVGLQFAATSSRIGERQEGIRTKLGLSRFSIPGPDHLLAELVVLFP